MNTAIKNIDEYIAAFPKETQVLLEKFRSVIRKAAPDASETINYGIPTFVLQGNLVHFGGFKKHIGFYPAPSGIAAFKKELAVYDGAKGSIQFPLDKPIPFDLVTKIVKFRVQENKEKALSKKAKKAAPKKAAKTKPETANDGAVVENWINKQPAAVKADINAVRKIIKGSSAKLSERIKWNAPSYYYKEDILTFGPYKTHKLLLVFHHPAVVAVQSPLLEGAYKDRRLVHFTGKAAAEKNKKELTRIINEIIKAIDKKDK